jgi:outer membrane protein assembly factor BamD
MLNQNLLYFTILAANSQNDINFAGILRMKTRKFFILSAAVGLGIALTSCSDYQKIARSEDSSLKYTKAVEYYEKGDYDKALTLFESLSTYFRNTPRGEVVDFDLANSYFQTGQYQLAAYQFRTFAEENPTSQRADEANYMYAYSLYMQSPKSDLDQSSTSQAINGFQDYLNKFPDSKHVEEINQHIDELRNKLEQKDIDNAYLYFKIEDYKSAVWALRNVVQQYPTSKKREWLEYLIIRSAYELAQNSVQAKQEERMQQTLAYYNDFRERYPVSEYDGELKKIIKNTNNYLQAIKTEHDEHQ